MSNTTEQFFFGRREELEKLQRITNSRGVTTVCGPPGVGKTALIRRFTRDVEKALVIDLTDADGTEALESAIARSMKLTLAPDASIADRRRAIAATIEGRAELVVLDNAEHLVETVRGLLSEPVIRDSGVSFVLTSRQRLEIADEHIIQLSPFPTDADDATDAPLALEYFRRRAATLGPAFELSDRELEDALALVEQLDGLPLAMELAAHRLNLLRPEQLLSRLQRSPDVLSTPWARSDRSRSLHHAIASSWDASTDVEQAAMRALALLPGAFDIEIAEAAVGEGALDLLQRLRDRSLLALESDGQLRMLGAIREYASHHGDGDIAALQRLAAFFAKETPPLVEAASRLEPLDAVDRLRSYRSHLQTVVQAAAEHPTIFGPDDLLHCGVALAEAVMLEGSTKERLPILSNLAQTLENCAPLQLRLGQMQREVGRLNDAAATLRVARADETSSDETRFAAALQLSMTLALAEKIDDARQAIEFADELSDGSDFRAGRLATHRANLNFRLGRFDEARREFEAAIQLARRAGDRRTETRAKQNLGVVLTDQQHLDEARKYLEDAIEAQQLHGDRLREAWAHNSLGVVELRSHHEDEGIRCFERAHRLFEQVGQRSGSAATLANLAMIASDFGRYQDAHRYALDALDRSFSGEDAFIRGMSYLSLAYSNWMLGRKKDAGRIYERHSDEFENITHIQLRVSWLAAHASYLASNGEESAEELFDRGEALLTDDPAHDLYRAMFSVSRAHLDLRALHDARGEGDAEASDRAAFSVLETVSVHGPAQTEPMRYVFSLLRHEAPDDLRELIDAETDEDASERLLVSRGLRALRAPRGQWASLGRSPSLWRLFEALLDARLESPGSELDNDALQQAVWPGEVLTPDSAANRLYVSLSKLRKTGLKPILLRGEVGYRLDEEVDVVSF